MGDDADVADEEPFPSDASDVLGLMSGYGVPSGVVYFQSGEKGDEIRRRAYNDCTQCAEPDCTPC